MNIRKVRRGLLGLLVTGVVLGGGAGTVLTPAAPAEAKIQLLIRL